MGVQFVISNSFWHLAKCSSKTAMPSENTEQYRIGTGPSPVLNRTKTNKQILPACKWSMSLHYMWLSKSLFKLTIKSASTATPGTSHSQCKIPLNLSLSYLKSMPFGIWHFHPRKMILITFPIHASHNIINLYLFTPRPLMFQEKPIQVCPTSPYDKYPLNLAAL